MSAIKNLIRSIKKGEAFAFLELHERFKPLIIAWMKQSKELYQNNREDYESMAKIILYECAQNYDEGRGVPFESYYKIKLYHWYANHKRKKQVETVGLNAINDLIKEQEQVFNEKRHQFNMALSELSETHQKIVLRIVQGFTKEQIAQELGLSKKTILNKKYEAISKLKEIIQKY